MQAKFYLFFLKKLLDLLLDRVYSIYIQWRV